MGRQDIVSVSNVVLSKIAAVAIMVLLLPIAKGVDIKLYLLIAMVAVAAIDALNMFMSLKGKEEAAKKVSITVFVAAAGILFVMFYPVLSGYPITNDYANLIKWLPSWVLLF